MTTAAALGLEGTLLFHLNLNQGAIEVASRRTVIARCYRPLLELAQQRPWLRLALAASGHTLERIARLDPEWIPRLVALCASGRIEFVGAGDTNLVGPLVPAAVNRWNQELGRETYLRLLARAPRVALVNEMAWSQGLVDAYLDAGYEAVITEGGPRGRAQRDLQRPVWTQSPTGRRVRLLLVDAQLRQDFQRAVAGESALDGYVATLERRVRARNARERSTPERGRARARHVFLYAGDAEVFDYRSGRSAEAPAAEHGEWTRMGELCDALRAQGVEFTTPARVLSDARFEPEATVVLSDAANPLPVRQQPGCNVTRWALSGWDGVGVNARCFARAKELERVGGTAGDWQLLCRAWGSDLRVHLTEKRWRRFAQSLPAAALHAASQTAFVEAPLRSRRVERSGKRLALGSEGVRVVLNLHRGLAIDALTLSHAGGEPLVGTLPLGSFPDSEWNGDATSGHVVLEVPGEKRVTDLEAVEPEVEVLTHCIRVSALVPTAFGPLPKEVRVYAQRLELRYSFSAWGTRPRGSLRAGALTLLEGVLGEELWVSCANGGARERLALVEDCDHGRAPSSLVSASAALGATDGWIALDDGQRGFEASWPQEEAAALPLLTFVRRGPKRLVRLVFSLSEIDDSHRPGAPLPDFRVSIRPYRNRR